MNNMELLAAGLKLMVFGMGMVFSFLIIMIFAMKLLEIVVRPFARAQEAKAAAAAAAKKPAAKSDDLNLAAIAAAAVEAFGFPLPERAAPWAKKTSTLPVTEPFSKRAFPDGDTRPTIPFYAKR